MKLLFISHSFAEGGAQKSLYELVSYCKQEGDDCLVVGPRSGSKIKGYIDNGVSVAPIRLGSIFLHSGPFWKARRIAQLFFNVCQITRHIRQFRPDIVYTNTSSVITGAVAAKLTRTPHIWHIRENLGTFPSKYIFALNILTGIITSLSEQVIFVSRLAMESLYPRGCSKAIVIHNGVDNRRFRDCHSAPACLRGKDDDSELTKVAFVGGLSQRRGLDVLLKAFAIVKPKYGRLLLDIWGDGDHRYGQLMQELAVCLDISEATTFRGYAADVAKILPTYDIIAVPSRSESFSRITLEAMASGVPVIATRCGGPEEFVEDRVTGRIVPPNDPEELAEALEYMIENPERAREMAIRARKQAEIDFKLEDKLHDIREIICQVAKKP